MNCPNIGQFTLHSHVVVGMKFMIRVFLYIGEISANRVFLYIGESGIKLTRHPAILFGDRHIVPHTLYKCEKRESD